MICWDTEHQRENILITFFIIVFYKILKLTSENFTARSAQANLARKSNIANYVKKDKVWRQTKTFK